ncbi:MAG: YidC/Oxa1 family membrane protein insertase [Oscillospiraceae bacterium]|jgi:YidC/Oxa1 family membrane protein insertase|nr:YidC/Oxa1 family membrane protein insertase [Oscillospiraceae bacterium]
MDIVFKPFGWILGLFYDIFGSYAGAVFAFTLLVNLILIPLKIKQQKTMSAQLRLKPKQDAIKEKYKDDRVKQNQALQELMQKEGSNPLSGCLPMLIQLPFLLIVYQVVRNPLTYIANVSADKIQAARELVFELIKSDKIKDIKAVTELHIVTHLETVRENAATLFDSLNPGRLNFNLLGLNLAEQPQFSFNFAQAKPIWIIPLLSFAAAIFSSLISMAMTKHTNPDQKSPIAMMLPMTLISLYFAFQFPGAVGFYWACSSLIGGIFQAAIQYLYNAQKLLAQTEAKTGIKRRDLERAKLEKAKTVDN